MTKLLITVLTSLVVVLGMLPTAHADFSNAVVQHESADQLMRVRGLKERWGQVEVRNSSADPTWYPVCYNWSVFFVDIEQKIANWICQTRLGLAVSYAEVVYGQPLSPDTPSMKAECPNKTDCTFSLESECKTNSTIFIYCPAPESRDLSLRLTGGPDERRGRLEIMKNGEWGSVCGDIFIEMYAKVACRQMGFNESLAHLYYLDEMAARNTILSLFGCLGNESRLIDCRHLFFGVLLNTCEKSAGVECRRSDDYSLRLSDSKNFTASNGRLDLKFAGQWKAVCGMIPEWTIKVACREMGLPTSSARMVPTSIKYPSENISIATEDFRCRGYESSITQCRVNHGHDDCNETFGIVCSGDPGYPVRLVGGDNSTGRLEVEISGIWGTVCNKTFDFWMAKVTCRALGFNKTVPLLWPNKDFGQAPPEQPAWLLSKTCFGHEDSLKNCFNGIGHKDQCTHETDVVISCKSLDEIDMPIRLVGGPDNTTGRLELFHDGQWGTVCSDLFGYKSAKVACRQLDLPYKGAIITKHVPISDPATGPVWLDKLQCRGEESHIIQCRHTIMPSCDHSKDVVLKCQDYIDIWNKYTKIRPKTSTLSTVTDNLKPKKKSEPSAVSGSYIGSGVASAIGAILMAVGGCCAKSKWDKRANSAGGNENGVAAAQYTPGNANSSVETPVEGVTLISNDQNKTSAPPPSYSDLFGKEGDSRTTQM